MNDTDIGRLIRIRSSIRGALEATSSGSATGAIGMVEAYATSRLSLSEALGEPLKGEMEATFPMMDPSSSGDLLEDANLRASARTRLGQMAGWIDGVIEVSERDARARSDAPQSVDRQ